MAPDKVDEVAAGLDDLAEEVEELHEEGGAAPEKFNTIERALEEAKEAIDDIAEGE